ncbi:MAG: hypothetical protein E7609_04605 [Ruminococcaceae bacterium]|nr:hypothetical protein [Oscillospiraceae bacterium]
MKKNNYSLMLSEGVVNAIDAEAARLGTNRSALINRILAEYVSYVTPEMRIRQILCSVRETLDGAFRRDGEGENILCMTTALSYRYNPTVRYALELYRSGESLGEIRVSMRTKNPLLLEIFADFCAHFAAVEKRYMGKGEYGFGEGRFIRVLRLRKNDGIADMMTLEELGGYVAHYISMLDRALKLYCRYAADIAEALSVLDGVYRKYLSEATVLL